LGVAKKLGLRVWSSCASMAASISEFIGSETAIGIQTREEERKPYHAMP
jgi:hypothetical protein